MKTLFLIKGDFSYFPLGVLTLSAVAEQHGFECEIIDIRFEPCLMKEIKAYNPDVIAYSVVSFDWKYFIGFNKFLKKKLRFISVFGGPHCTLYPQIINEEGVDIICRGEGENAFLELLFRLSNHGNITDIPNLWIKQNGTIYSNEISNLNENLDSIPFPSYRKLFKYHFYKEIKTAYIMTARGCPFNCSNCINHFYRSIYEGKGQYIRRRSIQNVISELEIIKNEYNAKLIIFNDDVFTYDEQWLFDFSERYINEIGLPFEAYVRADQVSENNIQKLSEMGCKALYFGIESGNPKIRNEILNKKISNRQILMAAQLLKKYNIKIMGFNMIGMPGETFSDSVDTLLLNAKCKIDYALCFVFQPFPAIKLTQYAIENNYFDGKATEFNKNLLSGKIHIKTPEKNKMYRLHHLFTFGVRNPALIGLVAFLSKLPFGYVYFGFSQFYKLYILTCIMYRPTVKPALLHHIRMPLVRFVCTIKSML